MIKHFVNRHITLLVLLLIFGGPAIGQTKIVRSAGTSPYESVNCGLQDKTGDMWFGTAQGVYRYNGKSFTHFTIKNGLSSNAICSLLEDKSGNIWVGTRASGVCRYDGHNFKPIAIDVVSAGTFMSNMSPNNNPYAGYTIQAMLHDRNGTIWLGTTKGVYCFDGKRFTHFLDNDGVVNKSRLNLKTTQKIIQDRNGNIWFTTWFEGVCRYDGKTITNFKPNNEVWYSGIFEDKKGNIWVGRRSNGVCRYDGNIFTNVLQKRLFDECAVQAITEDKSGNIWFGTEAGDMNKRETTGGVWRYNGTSLKNYIIKDGLPNCSVFCIVRDRAGNLWIGTRNTGLCQYDGKKFTVFSK